MRAGAVAKAFETIKADFDDPHAVDKSIGSRLRLVACMLVLVLLVDLAWRATFGQLGWRPWLDVLPERVWVMFVIFVVGPLATRWWHRSCTALRLRRWLAAWDKAMRARRIARLVIDPVHRRLERRRTRKPT